MSEKSCFRGPFAKQHENCAKALLKYSSQHLSYLLITFKEIELKKSLSLTCQIQGLLVNTLATDEKYHVLNRENLTKPIHIQLSQKVKTFY